MKEIAFNPDLTIGALQSYIQPLRKKIVYVSQDIALKAWQLEKELHKIYGHKMAVKFVIKPMPDKEGWQVDDYYSKGDNTLKI